MTPNSPLPADDLRTAIRWALEREAPLFAAGELVVLHRMLALGDDAAELYARLSLRVGAVFRIASLDYACATAEALRELCAADLLTRCVPDRLAVVAFTADALRGSCRRLGLPHTGNRAVVEARLAGSAWREEPVVLVLHRGLLARVERLGGFDRAMAPMERIIGVRWADYAPTGGAGAFATRRALNTYERARAGELTPEEALALAKAGPPPWGKSPFTAALEAVIQTDPEADTLAALPGCGLLHVRALEAEGRLAEALTRCRQGDPDPETALALARTGKRLARSLRAPWPPPPVLTEPSRRRLWLPRAPPTPSDPRPRWLVDGQPMTIESAAVALVTGAGRTALHSENWLWTSAFALVFRELYWLPLPGRLPTAHRSGPLDLGTPAFYLARREAAEAALARLQAESIRPFAAAWSGERLDGLVRAEVSLPVLGALGGPFVAAVLRRMVHEGWAAARGLPDLLVLPGGEVRLADAVPGKLPSSAFFAEIKGPTDSVRDGQRRWHHELLSASIHVELWDVSESK